MSCCMNNTQVTSCVNTDQVTLHPADKQHTQCIGAHTCYTREMRYIALYIVNDGVVVRARGFIYWQA